MRPASLLLFVALATFASAQEKATIKFAPKIDAVTVHELDLRISFLGNDAIVKANLNSTITGVKDDIYDLKSEFKDLTLDVNGTDPGVKAVEVQGKLGKTGTLQKIEGGIQGNDPARLYLLLQFLAPEKELSPDESYTLDIPELKEAGVPAYKFEGKYVGVAEVNGKKGFKFETKFTEANGGMTSTGTFIVAGDGVVLSAEVKFKSLPLPIVGQNVDGSISIKIKA